jgi:ferredoxin
MIPHLRRRCAVLGEAGLLEGCRIDIADNADEICFRPEAVDRRGFFATLRNSLLQSAATIIAAGSEQDEQRSDYGGKRVPCRRELLNRTISRLAPELERLTRDRYYHRIGFSGNCTTCQGCVAICPTGALLTNSVDESPHFDPHRCTGCGLCGEFCLDGAVLHVST